MNIEKANRYNKIAEWTARLLLVAMLVLVSFNLKSCAEGITMTDYTGWANRCEIAGGAAIDGKCVDPSALIEVPDAKE